MVMIWVKIIVFKIRYGGNVEKFMRKVLISFGDVSFARLITFAPLFPTLHL